MRLFFVGLFALLGISLPGVASAVDCSLPANYYLESCKKAQQTARPAIPYARPMICTIIRMDQPVRQVTFVVRDGAGTVLDPANSAPQHTADKKDHETFCVDRDWWVMARDSGGRVEFCVEPEPKRGLNDERYRWRWKFTNAEVRERLDSSERDRDAMAKFYATFKGH